MNSMIPAFWQLFIVGPNISLVMLSCLQIPVKAPNTARGELETTYLDEDLRWVDRLWTIKFTLMFIFSQITFSFMLDRVQLEVSCQFYNCAKISWYPLISKSIRNLPLDIDFWISSLTFLEIVNPCFDKFIRNLLLNWEVCCN